MNVLGRELLPRGDCLEWPGYVGTSGYGKRGNAYAHRAAYEEYVDPIPDGLCVMHTCDNKICCNPEHLRVGTQADNLRDMWDKGRFRHYRIHEDRVEQA